VLFLSGSSRNAAYSAELVEVVLHATDGEACSLLASLHEYTLTSEQLYAWLLQLPEPRAALKKLTE
jgi:NAD(P)H-dependent FMN reductase